MSRRGRSPGFRIDVPQPAFPVGSFPIHPVTPTAVGAVGEGRETPRLQWRGPRRHSTGFPYTTAAIGYQTARRASSALTPTDAGRVLSGPATRSAPGPAGGTTGGDADGSEGGSLRRRSPTGHGRPGGCARRARAADAACPGRRARRPSGPDAGRVGGGDTPPSGASPGAARGGATACGGCPPRRTWHAPAPGAVRPDPGPRRP